MLREILSSLFDKWRWPILIFIILLIPHWYKKIDYVGIKSFSDTSLEYQYVRLAINLLAITSIVLFLLIYGSYQRKYKPLYYLLFFVYLHISYIYIMEFLR